MSSQSATDSDALTDKDTLKAQRFAEELISEYGFGAEIVALKLASEADGLGNADDARLFSATFNALAMKRAKCGISIFQVNQDAKHEWKMPDRLPDSDEEPWRTALDILKVCGDDSETYVIELAAKLNSADQEDDIAKLQEIMHAIRILRQEAGIARLETRQ